MVALLASYFIGYAAVASSSSINVYFMRTAEMQNGVTVRDKETGESYGLSKEAARQGVFKTMYCRCTYGIPMFLIPALWTYSLTSLRLMPASLAPKVLLEVFGVCVSLYFAMPLGCALYP